MHPLTCYAGQISLCHAKIEKISEKIFVMMGGDNFWILWGGHRAHGGSPQSPPPPLGKTLQYSGHMVESSSLQSRIQCDYIEVSIKQYEIPLISSNSPMTLCKVSNQVFSICKIHSSFLSEIPSLSSTKS